MTKLLLLASVLMLVRGCNISAHAQSQNQSASVQDKSAWLNKYFRPLAALMKAGKFRWDTYEQKDVQARMFGDTAVVIGSMNLKGTGAKPSGHTWVESPETTFAGTLRFTRVWIKRGGSWRLAALQNGLLTEQR